MDSGVLGLGRTTVGWVGSLKGGVQSCEGANSKWLPNMHYRD